MKHSETREEDQEEQEYILTDRELEFERYYDSHHPPSFDTMKGWYIGSMKSKFGIDLRPKETTDDK